MSVQTSPGRDPEIQQTLLLVMPAKLDKLAELEFLLGHLNFQEVNAALDQIGTVHNTRLLVLKDDDGKWAKLMVAAVFDGSVEDYIGAFARVLNKLFNKLFEYVEDTPDKPPTPVCDNVDAFTKYVMARDCKPPGQPYSAYPDVTALDVYEAMRR
jgi:hypothetical protein